MPVWGKKEIFIYKTFCGKKNCRNQMINNAHRLWRLEKGHRLNQLIIMKKQMENEKEISSDEMKMKGNSIK